MKSLAILISGRGSNMEAIVRQTQQGVLNGLASVAVVISNNPEASGLSVAQSLGIQTEVLSSQSRKRREYDTDLVSLLDRYKPDYVVLAGFMRILTDVVIDRYPNRIINIHPADTACHQGLHGYEWAFRSGLSETWVTVHYVDRGLDSGKVIAKRRVDLAGVSSLDEVESRGLAVEHEFYSDCLVQLLTRDQTLTAW